MKYWLGVVLLAASAACVSVEDVVSGAEPSCGQACATEYEACTDKINLFFVLFPNLYDKQCADALHLCAQRCPPRKASE